MNSDLIRSILIAFAAILSANFIGNGLKKGTGRYSLVQYEDTYEKNGAVNIRFVRFDTATGNLERCNIVHPPTSGSAEHREALADLRKELTKNLPKSATDGCEKL